MTVAWNPPAASEVDANSPTGATLMGKLKACLDWLYGYLRPKLLYCMSAAVRVSGSGGGYADLQVHDVTLGVPPTDTGYNFQAAVDLPANETTVTVRFYVSDYTFSSHFRARIGTNYSVSATITGVGWYSFTWAISGFWTAPKSTPIIFQGYGDAIITTIEILSGVA